MPTFLPVQVAADAPSRDRQAIALPGPNPRKAAPAETGRIEIALPDGICIRVGADVDLTSLRRVMAAVRR